MRLYTWRRTGLADEVRSDAIPDAAGGEGGHGAAKPDGVIHRYVNYSLSIRREFQQLGGLALFDLVMLGSSENEGGPGNHVQRLDASDPRDRILRLSWIVPGCCRPRNQSKPCRSVYIDLGTNYLCLCQQDKRRDDLPSWVIGWSSPVRVSILNSSYSASIKAYPALNFCQLDGIDTLLINGVAFDKIDILGPVMYDLPRDTKASLKEV